MQNSSRFSFNSDSSCCCTARAHPRRVWPDVAIKDTCYNFFFPVVNARACRGVHNSPKHPGARSHCSLASLVEPKTGRPRRSLISNARRRHRRCSAGPLFLPRRVASRTILRSMGRPARALPREGGWICRGSPRGCPSHHPHRFICL